MTSLKFGSLFLALSCAVAQAQSVNLAQKSVDAPLAISNFKLAPGDQYILMDAQNRSSKTIEAFGLIAMRIDENGVPVFKTTRLMLASLFPGEKGLQPREPVHQEKIRIPFGKSQKLEIPHYEVSVDYVLFSDGTTWGPDTMNFARDVAQMRNGASMYRGQLNRLSQQGSDAVIRDIKKSTTAPPK